jgi:hypothetical protein
VDEGEGWRGTRATALAYTLIALAYGVLIARAIWSPRGAMEFLLGLVFVVVGFDAVLEILGAFIWGPRSRWIRGTALAAAALLYALLPT